MPIITKSPPSMPEAKQNSPEKNITVRENLSQTFTPFLVLNFTNKVTLQLIKVYIKLSCL